MPTTKRNVQSLYLDHDKAKLLDELAAETRIAKAVLLREAVDDLLTKYGKLKQKRKG
jgi:predicted transcriptional regulator